MKTLLIMLFVSCLFLALSVTRLQSAIASPQREEVETIVYFTQDLPAGTTVESKHLKLKREVLASLSYLQGMLTNLSQAQGKKLTFGSVAGEPAYRASFLPRAAQPTKLLFSKCQIRSGQTIGYDMLEWREYRTQPRFAQFVGAPANVFGKRTLQELAQDEVICRFHIETAKGGEYTKLPLPKKLLPRSVTEGEKILVAAVDLKKGDEITYSSPIIKIRLKKEAIPEDYISHESLLIGRTCGKDLKAGDVIGHLALVSEGFPMPSKRQITLREILRQSPGYVPVTRSKQVLAKGAQIRRQDLTSTREWFDYVPEQLALHPVIAAGATASRDIAPYTPLSRYDFK